MTDDASCDVALERRLRVYFHDELGSVVTPEVVWQHVARRLDLAERPAQIEHLASPYTPDKGMQSASARGRAVPPPRRPKRQQGNRWQGFAAVAAALLVIAIGATIFGVLGGGRSLGTHSGTTATSTPQRNRLTPLPAGMK